VALGVKTDRRLPEKIESISDLRKREKALQKQYKRENKNLGKAGARVVKSATFILTPAALLALLRTGWNGLQARAASNNLEILEQLAQKGGVDIRQKGQKRYIAAGVVVGLVWG
jgi:hypothetical protein